MLPNLHDADVRLVVLLVHAAATLMMTGLIWFVQLVHYPLFAAVGVEAFCAYENQHTRRTTWIVAPLMLSEAVTASVLALMPFSRAAEMWVWVGLALLLVNWLSTAFVQVPCHHTLCARFDGAVARRLVATNWIRTVAWSVRGGIALLLLVTGSE